MNTSQNYVGRGDNAPKIEPAAKKPPKTPSTLDNRRTSLLTVEEFISRHPDLTGLPLAEVAKPLNDRLHAHPVQYTAVLDAIALLRAFTPAVSSIDRTHYALLLGGSVIDGFVWIPAESQRTNDANNIIEYPSETSALFQSVATSGANRILLASTRTDADGCIDGLDTDQFSWLWAALDRLGVELLEYVMLYPTANVYTAWNRYDHFSECFSLT